MEYSGRLQVILDNFRNITPSQEEICKISATNEKLSKNISPRISVIVVLTLSLGSGSQLQHFDPLMVSTNF